MDITLLLPCLLSLPICFASYFDVLAYLFTCFLLHCCNTYKALFSDYCWLQCVLDLLSVIKNGSTSRTPEAERIANMIWNSTRVLSLYYIHFIWKVFAFLFPRIWYFSFSLSLFSAFPRPVNTQKHENSWCKHKTPQGKRERLAVSICPQSVPQ